MRRKEFLLGCWSDSSSPLLPSSSYPLLSSPPLICLLLLFFLLLLSFTGYKRLIHNPRHLKTFLSEQLRD